MITKFKIYEDLDNNKDLERLKNRYITYSSREEMIMVVKKLNELGIRTYRTLDSYKNSKRIHRFFYYNKGDNSFARSSDESILNGLYELPFKDFMKLGKKKYIKRKSNLNIDPYGEEEWGFDIIKNENIHNELDPYDEDNWGENDFEVGDKVDIGSDGWIGIIIGIYSSGDYIIDYYQNNTYRGYGTRRYGEFKKLNESVNNEINYRLGCENDLPKIKKLTNKLRNELGFVMNVVLLDAINKDELYVAEKNNDIIGFVHSHKRRDGWNTIH